MRPTLLFLLLVSACDSGVVKIEGGVDDAAPDVVTDTDVPADSDVAAPDDTDVPIPTDSGAADTDPPGATGTVLDAARLAWDANMRWTFTQWWGGTCVYNITEQGEELARSGQAYAEVAALCPSCGHLFEVSLIKSGAPCLEAPPATEWRGIEHRPTGKLVVKLFRRDLNGTMVARETLPNVTLSGSTFSLRYTTFAPVYSGTAVGGTVLLTPLP